MTLEEGKRKVYKLLDEYGTGDGMDDDLMEKMNDFFDTAQKDVAKISQIVRTIEMSGEGSHPMPQGFLAVHRVWQSGKDITRRCKWRAGELLLGKGETVELDYFAVPDTIDGDTPDSYEFEVREDACEAMPFYVAGMVLSSDLVQDANIYFELYERAKQNLTGGIPGSGRRIVNGFYKRS